MKHFQLGAVFGVALAIFAAQASDTRDAVVVAWEVLDSTWAAGRPDQQELVLRSLARVRSVRASSFFRQALRGSAGVAARAANLSPDWRVATLLPEIPERLKAEKEVGAQIELIACLKRVHTRAAADMVLPFALRDAEPLTGVAFGVLSDIGEVAVPALTTALKEGCWKCRESAAYVLTRITTPAATSALQGVLGDPNPHVRALAAIALARAGNASGVPILRATLGDSDYGFRIWATLALYNLGESQYQSALLKEYDAAPPDRRSFVARQIVREGSPPLRDQVIGLALNYPSPVLSRLSKRLPWQCPLEEASWPREFGFRHPDPSSGARRNEPLLWLSCNSNKLLRPTSWCRFHPLPRFRSSRGGYSLQSRVCA